MTKKSTFVDNLLYNIKYLIKFYYFIANKQISFTKINYFTLGVALENINEK